MCKILQETSVMDDGSLLFSKQNFFSHLLNGVEQRISSHGMTSEIFIICLHISYLSRLLVNSVTNRYQMSCMLLVFIGVFCIEGKTN